jgi:hypothetical protein
VLFLIPPKITEDWILSSILLLVLTFPNLVTSHLSWSVLQISFFIESVMKALWFSSTRTSEYQSPSPFLSQLHVIISTYIHWSDVWHTSVHKPR